MRRTSLFSLFVVAAITVPNGMLRAAPMVVQQPGGTGTNVLFNQAGLITNANGGLGMTV